MFNKEQVDRLMKNAQEMQYNLQKAQNEITKLEVEGLAGGGAIRVIMDGRHSLKKVSIESSRMSDKNTLEKMFVAAVNDATQKLEACVANKMMDGLSSGILDDLAGMKFPG